MYLSRVLLALSLFFAVPLLRAADSPGPTEKPAAVEKESSTAGEKPASQKDRRASLVEELKKAGVKAQPGPATVALGQAAELKLPKDYFFIGKDSVKRFYELTQNVPSGNEVGVVIAPDYMLFFDFDDVGYVKDDDKDAIKDADKLLKTMSENQDGANEDRKSRGWDEMKLKGWATPPHYDTKTNNLKWALNLASSRDNYKTIWINESVRLLGRSGVMNVTIATGTENFKAAEIDTDKLLADNFSYVAGQKYSEFKAGDKVAAYGLSALVLGGGAVMAAKMGLFAKFGVLLGKFWKMIVFAVIALGAAIKNFFGKIFGKKKDSGGIARPETIDVEVVQPERKPDQDDRRPPLA